ncbi:hypothetical protein HDU76_013860 [Blyttiomyces sp. JEL0837]|nr:hypothetical protein HDU76_013860 [Blyttiomyces sp. JEL0837]
MATVESIVLREKSLHDVNPALGSQHSDLHHRFIVVHLSDGKAKTVEYGHFENTTTGTIRIHEGAQTIHAMLEAHEFETNLGYPWSKFEHWILHESGYQNTPWSVNHQSETFNQLCLEHLNSHCKRPAHAAQAAADAKLDLKAPDADATAVFNAVKHDVIHKVHDLHKSDAVHHTHLFDKSSHLTTYKLVQYAIREVDYGFIYFGKVNIGNNQYIHVRVHKFHDKSKPLLFHSVRVTRDTAIWGESAKLEFFDA